MPGRNEWGRIEPAEHAFSITPSNTDPIDHVTRGIYVGASGDLKVLMTGGETVTFVDLAAGVIHPIAVIQVFSTGTDATGIVGLY